MGTVVLMVYYRPCQDHLAQNTEQYTWKSVKKIYQGQYGVHLDPQTAYQQWHGLHYDQFNSVQGLVDAKRDYQRMAPTVIVWYPHTEMKTKQENRQE